MAKLRADQLLVDRGLAESRARAQALILAGLVFLGDRKIDKAGQQVPEDAALEVKGRDHPWVSRGGIKLAHAIEHFALDVRAMVAIASERTIAAAAHAADFADAAHLTRTFYQMVGMAPSALMRGDFIEMATPFNAPADDSGGRQTPRPAE